MDKKVIFLVMGRTGSGKDSLVNFMCENYGTKSLISYTTRQRRKNEKDTHIFISQEEVENYKEDMIASTQIGEHIYFATKSQLKDCLYYIIDPKGAKILLSNEELNKEFKFITIYIYVPEAERKRRVISIRHDDYVKFVSRNNAEDKQFSQCEKLKDYNYLICNSYFDRAKKSFENIVKSNLQLQQGLNKKEEKVNECKAELISDIQTEFGLDS